MPRASPMAEGQGTGCQEPEQGVKRDGKACAWRLRGLACSPMGRHNVGGGWESGSGLCRGSECVRAGLRNGQAHGASAAGGEGRWPENLQPAWKMRGGRGWPFPTMPDPPAAPWAPPHRGSGPAQPEGRLHLGSLLDRGKELTATPPRGSLRTSCPVLQGVPL